MKRAYQTFYLMIFIVAATISTGNLSAQVIIDKVTDTTAVVGEVYAYQMTATASPDNETYTLEVGLEGMGITSAGKITWTPTGISKGGRVVVKATNSEMESATKEFFIYVTSGVTCPTNVTAYWKMDETVSPYVDYKGTNDAILSGGLLTDSVGKIGRAPVFKSSKDNQLSVPNNDVFNWSASDEFSIEFWYNNKINDLSKPQVMIGRNDGSQMHWWIGMSEGENLVWYMRQSYGSIIADSVEGSSDAGTWYHVVAVRDASDDEIKLYRNGFSSSGGNANCDDPVLSSATLDLNIGWLHPEVVGYPKYQYDGMIDEIVIYNKALVESEIIARYNGGNPTPVCPYANFAPAFRTTPLTSVNEESPYTYQYLATDIEGDVLEYDTVKTPSWLNWNEATRTLSGTPSDYDVGIFQVQIKVNDGTVDVYQNFSITVNNVNDRPVLSNLETAALAYDEDDGEVALTSAMTVTDVDDTNLDSARVWISANYTGSEDVLAFTNAAGISGVWNATTGSLKLTGTAAKAAYQAALRSITYENTNTTDPSELERTVSFTVNDGALNSIVRTRNIAVTSVNDCPDISGHQALGTPEEDTILIKIEYLTFTDVDDAPGSHTLTVVSGDNYTTAGNIVTPATDYNGTLDVNVQLSDSKCTLDYVLPVTVTGVNDAPEFNFQSLPTDAYEQQTYMLKIRASDPDVGDIITYSVTQKPGWLNIISDTILTGVPDYTDYGPNPVTIRVSDGTVNVDTSFVITVHSTNDIPHITSTPPTSINENELYLYNIEVVDTNAGDPLILTAPVLPGWLTLNTGQQILTGTPTRADLGSEMSVDFQVQLKVSDGKQDSTQTFTITVFRVTAVEDITSGSEMLNVYPNPASDFIKFESDLSGMLNIEIIDITGKTVYNDNVRLKDNPFEISTSNMPNGLYFYKVYNNTEHFVGSIIIKR
jgi:hypothetical protein